MFRKFLQSTLRLAAILVLKKYKPRIVAITGSVGKSSTKEAIFAVLRPYFRVRKNEKNYNNEIGVPLTIIGGVNAKGNIFLWFWNYFKAIFLILFPVRYPQILVLEMGADKPGDIRYLTEFVKPEISVVTAVGEIPVHVEFFAGPESVAREKRILVEVLPVWGRAILNYDDATVFDMRERTEAHVLTYGFGEGAKVWATNYELDSPGLNDDLGGVNFKINFDDSFAPVRLTGMFGKQNVYSALAAAAVGTALDLNLIEIIEGLSSWKALPGRMKMLRGVKHSWIIDDTYNASPMAVHAALDALRDLAASSEQIPTRRKIAVLGDMLELGKFTIEAHEAVGQRAAKCADLLLTVGARGRLIADEAVKQGMDADNVFSFDRSEEAGEFLENKIKEGDLILVKGSRSMKMEKIVRDIMAEPEKAKKLLVS
ncbi:MAG: UDP-N-acetylmuramoyl-tripeptide--D-alanyl-D-alanine ligase [bacterium]|nr:UDP-N-acetylmuramoyl-tripeptide--D-alanyl-D-alanine ligase [bacterium]